MVPESTSRGVGVLVRFRRLGALVMLTAAAAVMLWAAPVRAATWVYAQQGTPLSYLRGTTTPPSAWTTPGYSESGWTTSSAGFGIGYGDGDDATVLSDMSGSYVTVYVRSHFTVGSELSSIQYLELEATFDDGFVAYLNGTEIGRASVPSGTLQASDTASGHETTDGTVTFSIDPGLLVSGDNVLAVEVHNASLSSSDLSFIPHLFGADQMIDADITRGPYLQQMHRRDVKVVWETNVPAPSTVAYGPTDALELSVEDATPKTHHVVTLDGLAPNSWYHYQVQSATNPSPVSLFTTEVDRADPYRVAVYGDCRSGHDEHEAIINHIVGRTDGQPVIGFLTGDLVADGDQADLWDIFFDREAPLLRTMALSPALGNHEASGNLYVDAFELPDDTASPERYYSVRYATVLAVVINLYGDAYDEGSTQYVWLDQTLSAAAADPHIRHIWAFLHHSAYSSGSHGSSTSVRSELAPLFEQYGVELVFAGHDHHYERTIPVNGVRWVVTGGAGAGLYSVAWDTWTEQAESVHHYITLDLEGPRLDYNAWRMDGSNLDSFTMGDDLSECSQPSDCTSFEEATCEADEEGEWRCVHGACIYNCHYEPPPDGPDAGVGGGSGGEVPTAGSGGTGTQGGVPGATPDDESGCGCRVGPTAGALAWIWAVAAAGAVALRRRRRRARRH